MYVVIFRATARALDEAEAAEYSTLAQRLRDMALRDFGCIEFVAVTEGDREIALSYWHSEADIRAWKAQADHAMAQRLGRERWYAGYRVQIAEIRRDYAGA